MIFIWNRAALQLVFPWNLSTRRFIAKNFWNIFKIYNKDFFIRIFSENDQVPKIKVAEVRKGENIVLDVIEIARKIMKKNSEFANSLCSENVQKVQKDALFHMTVTHPRLWNYVNSTFWKDVRKKKNACTCTKAFPANIFILVTGNYFSQLFIRNGILVWNLFWLSRILL